MAMAAAFAFGVSATALAQTSTQPGQTKGQTKGQQPAPQQAEDEKGQRFDDWLVRCEQPPQGGAERCFMVQNILAQNDEGKRVPLLNVIIGHGEADGQPITVMQFTVPLGLYLPSGIGLQIDQAQPIRVAIEVCTNQACVARYRLEEAVRSAMQKGQQAKVQLVRANRQAIDVPISLKGFTKAYAALK
jgi:invasion protein IalB